MSDYEVKVDYLIEHLNHVIYGLLDDDVIVDGVLNHHVEGIRKRLLEAEEQQ